MLHCGDKIFCLMIFNFALEMSLWSVDRLVASASGRLLLPTYLGNSLSKDRNLILLNLENVTLVH